MRIRFLGAHNTESRDTRLVSLLIDDVLALDAGGLTSGLTFDEQLRLKAVLLTHQHYDHIRDIPMLGMNLFLRQASIDVYSIPPVREALRSHLLNRQLYPAFLEGRGGDQVIRFHAVESYKEVPVAGYRVLPLPVAHAVKAVGYQVTSPAGDSLFFTGDTGPGLSRLWRYMAPQLIVTEVTAPDSFEQFGRDKGHLTPCLLKEELLAFQRAKGYLPPVATVHMNPALQQEIAAELAEVAAELGTTITPAAEGDQICL